MTPTRPDRNIVRVLAAPGQKVEDIYYQEDGGNQPKRADITLRLL